jgi:hypothetical protein
LRDRDQILHSGSAGPDGPRGVVVRYPRTLDYFRRGLARLTVDHAIDDPAAKLLAMTQRLLAPEREGGIQPKASRA